MGKRYMLLMAVVLVRLIVGGVLSHKCETGRRVKVAGIVERVYQDSSKQSILIGNFLVELRGKNFVAVNEKVVVTGNCSRRVIDFFISRNRLINAVIVDNDKRFTQTFVKNSFFTSLREKLVISIRRVVPWPESEVVAGIVLGYKGKLDEYYDKFVNAGLIHVLVASGYNVTIVIVLFFDSLISYVTRKRAALISLVGISGYVLLAGAEPPLLRAALMGSILMLAKAWGKQVSGGWILWLVAALMVMFQPSLITNISFQLSVASMAGLVYLQPVVEFWYKKARGKWRALEVIAKTELLTTLSAQIMTAPVIWWHFGRVSMWGIVTNLVVLPLVPYIMGVGTVAMIASFIWLPLGIAPGMLTYGLTKVLILVSSLF